MVFRTSMVFWALVLPISSRSTTRVSTGVSRRVCGVLVPVTTICSRMWAGASSPAAASPQGSAIAQAPSSAPQQRANPSVPLALFFIPFLLFFLFCVMTN
jgi:hypothetical protein